MAQNDQPGTGYLDALRRGFQFARELGRDCGPAAILVGVSEGDGPAAVALASSPGPSLRSLVADAPASVGTGYLQMQAQQAAGWLAEALGQQLCPEHLLIALLDQRTPEVLQALSQAGLDRAAIRRAALSAAGAPPDYPPVRMPALAPAGTMDRPPLPTADLDPRAWAVLRWRQDHLPLRRLQRAGDLKALARLEQAAAWRLAESLGLGDDQRYSLMHHHGEAVHHAIARVPGATTPPHAPAGQLGPGRTGHSQSQDDPAPRAWRIARRSRRLRGYGLPAAAFLQVTVGWGVWVRNRRNNLRYRWVWLRTRPDYRGGPQP